MMLRCTILLGCLAALAGCGVQFADIPANQNLPDDYKTRIMWGQTDTFKYNLAQLAGHVIVGDLETGKFTRGPRYVGDFTPTAKPIAKDKGIVYSSKVTNKAAAQGSYLVFAASLSTEQIAEVTISDNAVVFIPWEEIPEEDLRDEASRPAPDGKQKYYVQAVLLANINIKNYTKIDSNSKGVVGNAVGVEGSVFQEEREIANDYKISLTLVDLESMKPAPPNSAVGTLSAKESVVLSSSDQVNIEIDGLE